LEPVGIPVKLNVDAEEAEFIEELHVEPSAEY
jgi:hypothetical protein